MAVEFTDSTAKSLDSVVQRRPSRNGTPVWILLGCLLVVVVGGGAIFMRSTPEVTVVSITDTVKRGRFLITVSEDGNVESADNREIKCRVAGGSTILSIVEDGKYVQVGDKLVELDTSNLEDQKKAQMIVYEKANAARIQSEADNEAAKIALLEYAVFSNSPGQNTDSKSKASAKPSSGPFAEAGSNVSLEKTDLTPADRRQPSEYQKIGIIELRAMLTSAVAGTYVMQFQDFTSAIQVAEENLSSSENLVRHTQKMFRKGFTTQLQLQADLTAVKRMQSELKSAKMALSVLSDFTGPKMITTLSAAQRAAEAKMNSDKAAFDLEVNKLERLDAQLKNCTIFADKEGMVVYANESSRRGSSGVTIEEGAAIREQQTILRIPVLTDMQVKVKVHETKIERLAIGMPARIVVQGREFTGKIKSIANQPEPSSWMNSSVKEYATIVSIETESERLKPGMTAEVEILVADVDNALTVPVAAVIANRGTYYCLVQTEDGVEERSIEIGRTNDRVVEIVTGITEGEVVVLNTRDAMRDKNEVITADQEPKAQKDFGAPALTAAELARLEAARKKSKKKAPSASLMQYDKNGDGLVSFEELPADRQRAMEFVDRDKDGFINKSEAAAAAAAAAAARKTRKGGPGGPPT